MNFDRRIVITREADQAKVWQERLLAAGLDVDLLPLIDYEAIDPDPALYPADFDWLLFTSPQGVRRYAQAYPGEWTPRQAALGLGTGAVLADCGGRDELALDCKDGADFAAAFCDRVSPPASLLLPGAEKRLSEPMTTLARAGFGISLMPLYRTSVIPPSELPAAPCSEGDIVFFASPSAVRAFGNAWPQLRVDCAAIGETTALAAREAGLDPAVAATPGLEGLCQAVGIELGASGESMNGRKMHDR